MFVSLCLETCKKEIRCVLDLLLIPYTYLINQARVYFQTQKGGILDPHKKTFGVVGLIRV